MSGFDTWREAFCRRHATLAAYLPNTLSPLPEVAHQSANQAEFTLSVAAYMDKVMPASRIARGRAALAQNQHLLDDLHKRYQVPGEIIVAIWGIETDFGAIQGDIPVLRALATLAHTGPRANYFEAELLAALQLVAAGTTTPDFTGSWAGASGHCQFMPSAVLEYGVDHDGDGHADIWGDDPTDALASIASYLSAHGWQAQAPWLTETPPAQPETLLIPAGLPGPAFRTGPNFQVLLSYNRATLYALGVGLLAHAIAETAAPPHWPDRLPLGRAELGKLQETLTAKGYDTKGADGLLGTNTRAAIRAWQKANGLPADGFPSKDLLLHLG